MIFRQSLEIPAIVYGAEPKRAKEGGFMSKETIVTTDNPSILIAKKHFENKNVRFRVPDRNEN